MLLDFCINLTRVQKRAILLFVDACLIVLAYLAARAFILPAGPASAATHALTDLAMLVPVGTGLTAYLGLHRIKLNAYGMQGVIESAFITVMMIAAGISVNAALWADAQPRLFVVFGMMFLIAAVASRLLMRDVLLAIYRSGTPRQRVLIYGAGQTGQQLAAALQTDDAVVPVAFVDDNPTLQSLTVAGLRVYAPAKLDWLIDRYEVNRIVLAMPTISNPEKARITRRLRELGCPVQVLPSFADLVAKGGDRSVGDPLEMSQFLGRNKLEEELPGVSDTYRDHAILVTGAGGSIGSELCRQLVTCAPRKLVLLDHSELALYAIQRELAELAPGLEIVPVLGSICEAGLVGETLDLHGISVVLHAAAYKHLPMVEDNPLEGMRNNVLGTKVLADAARAAGVERFILISSDKAVRPTSAMGSSKRLAELVIQDLATRSTDTRFSMVRFGNVLGSSGSVIPLFEEQIQRGGPVTLTHSDVTRYFMTVSEAVRLVLLAGSFARGGDVFVLDMGKPVPIAQVARQMIEGAGLSVKDAENPAGDIEIQITGLRPGEKLHEELLIGSDMLTTPHPKILRAQETKLSEIEMANLLQALRKIIDLREAEALPALIGKWIETGPEDDLSIINE